MRFILRRLGFYLIAFFVALSINFFLPRLIPGDPATAIVGRPGVSLTPEQLNAVRTALGLSDAPLMQQYFSYLAQLARGDLGISYTRFPASVISVIRSGFVWTLLLTLTALLISFVLGHLLGIFSAWRRGTFLAKALPPGMILFGAFPAFFIAISAVYYLGYQLRWFPTMHAYDVALTPGLNLPFLLSVGQHMALPVLVLVLTSLGGWALGMRNAVPTIFISVENPYHLVDAPRMQTYINTYNSGETTLRALVDKLVGRSPFKGVSPVDAFCGMWDTKL